MECVMISTQINFTFTITMIIYQASSLDHTLFLQRKAKVITYRIIYMDNTIIAKNNIKEINWSNVNLFRELDTKDLKAQK